MLTWPAISEVLCHLSGTFYTQSFMVDPLIKPSIGIHGDDGKNSGILFHDRKFPSVFFVSIQV